MDRSCDSVVPDAWPLRLAVPGRPCRVVAVEGDPDATDRLKQMGLCEGRQVQLIQPGDPLIVRLYGSRMALSARLAEAIRVAPLPCCPALWENARG